MAITTIERSLDLLHPTVRPKFQTLAADLKTGFESGETKTLFLIFETFRSPQRQQYLYHNTTSTKSQAWESAHQYGLAGDFVPHLLNAKEGKGWYWDSTENPPDWQYLRQAARRVGLDVPLKWDKAHVQAPAFTKVRVSFSS